MGLDHSTVHAAIVAAAGVVCAGTTSANPLTRVLCAVSPSCRWRVYHLLDPLRTSSSTDVLRAMRQQQRRSNSFPDDDNIASNFSWWWVQQERLVVLRAAELRALAGHLLSTPARALVRPLAICCFLRELIIGPCNDLRSLDGLEVVLLYSPFLEALTVQDCRQLVDVSALTRVENAVCQLRRLAVTWCPKVFGLDEVVSRMRCTALLEDLDLSGNDQLVTCARLASLPPSLRVLRMRNCSSLVDTDGLPPSLTALDLSECGLLEHLSPSSFSKLADTLQELVLDGCIRLSDISVVTQLTKLRRIILGRCNALVSETFSQ